MYVGISGYYDRLLHFTHDLHPRPIESSSQRDNLRSPTPGKNIGYFKHIHIKSTEIKSLVLKYDDNTLTALTL